jgi:hypothetical protein
MTYWLVRILTLFGIRLLIFKNFPSPKNCFHFNTTIPKVTWSLLESCLSAAKAPLRAAR